MICHRSLCHSNASKIKSAPIKSSTGKPMKSKPLHTLLFFIALPCHADSSLTANTGIDSSTGKYGQAERTDTITIPIGVKYEVSDWTFRATIPFVESTGPSNVSGSGADRISLNTGQSTRTRASGLGDLVLAASWTAFQQGPWLIDLGAKVKVATAAESKGLGTGKNDFSVQTDIYRVIGSHTLFGNVGFKVMGDPDGIDLKDPFYTSLGWSFRATQNTALGFSYDFRQKIQAGGSALREATGFLTHKLNKHLKLQAYLVSGFSNASPDIGGGVFVSYMH